MRKSTTSKTLFLLPILCAGIINAQVSRIKTSTVEKTSQELAKSHGFERCGTTEYEEFLRKSFPGRMSVDQFESWLKPLVEKAKASKSQNGNIVTIPVVVHVIHGGQAYGAAPNIVDEQVISQITVMNNDFRRLTGTPGFNSSAVGADTQIQFALAKVDPNGNPTNGIDRVRMCQSTFKRDIIEGFVKPETIWDPTQYMNMWSVAFAAPNTNLLGYAQFPDGSSLPGLNAVGGANYTDGVVANFSTFGSSDYGTGFLLGAPYDKGRTMTHEVGHFLGLRHIWGDATCGTDYCADTPTAHQENYNCPTTNPSCDNPSIFEMVQNYMDYTNDACMNIFTNDQKARLTAVMNNSPRRASLKTSTRDLPIALFPNDAEIKIERACGTPSCSTPQALQVSLFNRGTSPLTAATISYSINGNAQSFNWTGNLAQDKFQLINLPVVANTAAGPVTVSIASVNGGTDQRASNNIVTGSYVGAPANAETNVVFNLQLDYYGTETSWTLKNSAGTTVYSGSNYPDVVNPGSNPIPALITQNWTLSPNECYTFTINDSFGDGFSLYGGYYNIKSTSGATLVSSSSFTTTQSRLLKAQVLATNETVIKEAFGLYPNPASDVLNITKVSNKAKFEIYNAVGQLVKAGNIDNNQVRVAELVKGTYIITIKDNNISESIKFIKK